MTCLKELSSREKPREKLIQHGARMLTDPELLAILLRTGTRGCSVLDVARSLMSSLPGSNLGCLGEITLNELCRIRGIGPDKAVTLCAAVELGRRIVRCRVRRDNPDFSSPQVIAEERGRHALPAARTVCCRIPFDEKPAPARPDSDGRDNQCQPGQGQGCVPLCPAVQCGSRSTAA